jgi:hypothetical protein
MNFLLSSFVFFSALLVLSILVSFDLCFSGHAVTLSLLLLATFLFGLYSQTQRFREADLVPPCPFIGRFVCIRAFVSAFSFIILKKYIAVT